MFCDMGLLDTVWDIWGGMFCNMGLLDTVWDIWGGIFCHIGRSVRGKFSDWYV